MSPIKCTKCKSEIWNEVSDGITLSTTYKFNGKKYVEIDRHESGCADVSWQCVNGHFANEKKAQSILNSIFSL